MERPHLRNYYVTGGACARLMAGLQLETVGIAAFDAGGPIDAPDSLPAGACNSTDLRTGPWHLNGGRGVAAPAQSFAAREA